MSIRILTNENGVTIQGDEYILSRLPEDFDVNEVDLSDARIDAQNVNIAYQYATYKGIEAVKYYAAIKDAFIKRQEQATERLEASRKETNEPAITTQSLKPIDE